MDANRPASARLRIAGLCGLGAFATFNLGWIAGDLAQRAAFSPANDDLLSRSADRPQPVALQPARRERLRRARRRTRHLRLDCQSIDTGCKNDSWHSHAHKIESALTAGFTFLSIVLLALAFRGTQGWRHAWLPTIAAIPLIFVANIVFSTIGSGAATRAGTVVVIGAFAFFGYQLLRHADT